MEQSSLPTSVGKRHDAMCRYVYFSTATYKMYVKSGVFFYIKNVIYYNRLGNTKQIDVYL